MKNLCPSLTRDEQAAREGSVDKYNPSPRMRQREKRRLTCRLGHFPVQDKA
jgi:hypothetical protein